VRNFSRKICSLYSNKDIPPPTQRINDFYENSYFYSETFDKLINTGYGQTAFSILMCFKDLRSYFILCCFSWLL